LQDATPEQLAAQAWVEVQEPLDRQLEPLGRPALQALAPKPGERVLDIGCGAGQTVMALAEAVGPGGAVVGVDIAAPLIAVARHRSRDLPAVAFVEGDAQRYPFERGAFDAAFSRFGVMFFADPVAAFGNIHRALRPGGRLAFVCWRAFEENELDFLPLRAASPHLPAWATAPQAAPPFSFAKPDTIRAVLSAAGFEGIAIEADDQAVGSDGLEPMLEVSLRVGPLGKVLRENPEYRDAAAPAVRAALVARGGPGVTLNAATWVVTARRAAA
jgi:SAM-dependent methyltransferase